jgi:hypothetical protein
MTSVVHSQQNAGGKIMKESITKIAMVLALALSGITHESCAKETVCAQHIVAPGIGVSFSEEVMSNINKMNEVTAEGRELYARIDELAERDYEAAKMAAEGMRADIIGALAIAEFLFQALPDVSVIRSFPKTRCSTNFAERSQKHDTMQKIWTTC